MLIFSKNAFVSLIQSCSETYPLEATGVLFGHEKSFFPSIDFDISSTVCFQIVEKRAEDEVVESLSKRFRTARLYDNLTGEKLLGSYHSHPDGPSNLSSSDEEYLLSYPKLQFEIQVCLEETEDIVHWDYKGKAIVGGVEITEKPYRVDVIGFYLYRNKIRKLDLHSVYVDMVHWLNKHLSSKISHLSDILERVRGKGKNQLMARTLLRELEIECYTKEKKTVVRKICREIDALLE